MSKKIILKIHLSFNPSNKFSTSLSKKIIIITLLIVLLNKNLEFLGVGVFDLSPIFIYLINVLQDELKLL